MLFPFYEEASSLGILPFLRRVSYLIIFVLPVNQSNRLENFKPQLKSETDHCKKLAPKNPSHSHTCANIVKTHSGKERLKISTFWLERSLSLVENTHCFCRRLGWVSSLCIVARWHSSSKGAYILFWFCLNAAAYMWHKLYTQADF